MVPLQGVLGHQGGLLDIRIGAMDIQDIEGRDHPDQLMDMPGGPVRGIHLTEGDTQENPRDIHPKTEDTPHNRVGRGTGIQGETMERGPRPLQANMKVPPLPLGHPLFSRVKDRDRIILEQMGMMEDLPAMTVAQAALNRV